MLGPNRRGACLDLRGIRMAIHLPQQPGITFKAHDEFGGLWSQRLLPDGQRALEEQLGLRIFASGLISLGKPAESAGDLLVLRPEDPFPDRESPLEQRLGLSSVTLPLVQRAELAKSHCNFRMLR